jgi:HPt (histidine-containing phosphotransfer) domain-containing protein
MNGNMLEFALGLSSGGFLAALAKADSGLKSLIGTALSFGAVTAGLMSAFEKGAGLEKLSRQTGESAGEIYKLQRGFEAAGVAADNVGPAIMAMQRALGGVNEMGENTADIFRRMGLSASQLKQEGAAQQIQQITTALAGLNSSDASRAASSIFGRQNSANMLAIARSAAEFQQAIREASNQARVFDHIAESFERIDRIIASIKNTFGNFWVGLAVGLEPELTKVLGKIKNFGNRFGPALAEAARTGQLGELLEDTLAAAFESGAYYGGRVFSAMAVAFGDAVGTALTTAIMDFVPEYLNALKNSAQLLASRSRENYEADQYTLFTQRSKNAAKSGNKDEAIYWARQAEEAARKKAGETEYQNKLLTEGTANLHAALQEGSKNIVAGLMAAVQDVITDWNSTADPNAPHAARDRLNARVAKLNALVANEPASPGKNPPPGVLAPQTSYTYKPEFTQFEKMGFVMQGGSANPATEYARRTATAAEKTNSLLETTIQLLNGGAAGEPEHGM